MENTFGYTYTYRTWRFVSTHIFFYFSEEYADWMSGSNIILGGITGGGATEASVLHRGGVVLSHGGGRVGARRWRAGAGLARGAGHRRHWGHC